MTRLLRDTKLSRVHKDGDPVLPIWKRERCVLTIHLIGVKSLEDSFPIYLKLETVDLRNFLPVLQVISLRARDELVFYHVHGKQTRNDVCLGRNHSVMHV